MANIKLTKEQQQYLVAGVLMTAAFGYGYISFFWLPISQKKTETRKKIEETEAKIEKARRQAARLPRLEAELVDLNQRAEEAERRLPKKKSVPDILVTVSALAAKYRVTLMAFAQGGSAQKQFFNELSYPVRVRGSFHNVGRFLAAISLEERIFNVSGVKYSEASGDLGEMVVEFTLISYQYKG